MRRPAVTVLAAALLAACDTTVPFESRDVTASTLEAEHLGTIPSSRGARVSFRYLGAVPRGCYGGGYGYSTGGLRDGRIEIEAQATRMSGSCETETATLEIFPLDIDVPVAGTYVFAFARDGQAPLDVSVDVTTR